MWYAELRFAPQFHLNRGLSMREVIQAVLDGQADGQADCPDIETGILLCAMGTLAPPRRTGSRTWRRCAWQKNSSTRGAGWSASTWPDMKTVWADYADVFALARELGVPATCHSEFEVPQCLPFGTPRIGHGYQVAQRQKLLQAVKARGVTLEMCPVSSIVSYDLPKDAAIP